MSKLNSRTVLLNLNSNSENLYDVLNFTTLRLKTRKSNDFSLDFDCIYKNLACFQSEELKNIWHKIWNLNDNSIIFIAGNKFLQNVGQSIISFFMDQLAQQELNDGGRIEKWFGVSYVDHLGNIQNVTTKDHPESFYLSKFQSISQIETRYQDDILYLNSNKYLILTTLKLIKNNKTKMIRLVQLPQLSNILNQQKGIGKLVKDIQLKLYSHRKGYTFEHPSHPILDLINMKNFNFKREKQNLLTILISSASQIKFAKFEISFGTILLKGEIKKEYHSIEFKTNVQKYSNYKDAYMNLYNKSFILQDENELLKKINFQLNEKKKKFKKYVCESRAIILILSHRLRQYAKQKLRIEKKFEQKGKKLSMMHVAPFQYYLTNLRKKILFEKKRSKHLKKNDDSLKKKNQRI